MSKRRPGKMWKAILAFVLVWGMISTVTTAEAGETDTGSGAVAGTDVMETGSVGNQETEENTLPGDVSGSGTNQPEEQKRNNASSEEETAEPSGEVSSTETDGTEAPASGTDEDMEEQVEESDGFEETGIFDCFVTDENGCRINAWHDPEKGTYDLFLTRACRMQELEITVTGVRIRSASSGSIDEERNCVAAAVSFGESIQLEDREGKSYTVVVMQSELPGLSITLNGTDLNTVHENGKDVKYGGNSLLLTDASGNISLQQENVELKGRGNTTWIIPEKKGYQIKFEKKQSVLGMPKAKKWVLLAAAFDDSMMRNKTAAELSKGLGMPFTADFRFVDLWINGEYRGIYLLGEKNEIGSGRLNLTDDYGILMEEDNSGYREEALWFHDQSTQSYYALKDSVSDDPSVQEAAVQEFQRKLDSLLAFLSNTDRRSITLEDLGKYLDLESAAQYYLTVEYLANYEAYYTSYFWYMDGTGDVLHMGPVWDFDSSQGNKSGCSPYSSYAENHILFRLLLQTPAFSDYLKQYYVAHGAVYQSLPNAVDSMQNDLAVPAEMNYARWNWLGKPNQKQGSFPFADSFSAAADNLKNWLLERYQAFVPGELTQNVYIEGGKLVFSLTDAGYSNLRAAVWPSAGGTKELRWISADRQQENWTGSVSVQSFAHDGYINLHVYDGSRFITSMGIYLNRTRTVTFQNSVSGKYLFVNAAGYNLTDDIRAALWTDQNGQDDLKWYRLKPDGKGNLQTCADLAGHGSEGTYQTHVYRFSGNGTAFLSAYSGRISVSTARPVLQPVYHNDSQLISVNLKEEKDFSSVSAAVWSQENGQDDLKWYDAAVDRNGSALFMIDPAVHGGAGVYNIHVYGCCGDSRFFAVSSYVQVPSLRKAVLSAEKDRNSNLLQVTVSDAAGCTDVRIALWGEKNGQNDLTWYPAGKTGDGEYAVTVDLTRHRETGRYQIHAYGNRNGKTVFLCGGTASAAALKPPAVTLRQSDSGRVLNISALNASSYGNVRAAVWSERNGQDDLQWVSLVQDSGGSWHADADIASHRDTGVYHIHVYGTAGGKERYLCADRITVTEIQQPSVTIRRSYSLNTLICSHADDFSEVRCAVWNTENGQDDLKWYHAGKSVDGRWVIVLNSRNHPGKGELLVHFYGYKGKQSSFIAGAAV